MFYKALAVVLFVSVIQASYAASTEKGKSPTEVLSLISELIGKNKSANCSTDRLPIDCEDVLRSGKNTSGVYKILPLSRCIEEPIYVYCDMETDGGGWTVIQRRGKYLRRKDFFSRLWKSYKEGFGNLTKDFWLGNDNIFGLSNQRKYSVRFDLKAYDGTRRSAIYDRFWIDDEEHQYTLHIKGYSGDAGDAMIEMHDGQKFSTRDHRNDKLTDRMDSCAEMFKGGWWYSHCHGANLNGLLYGKREANDSNTDGVIWFTFKGYHQSLESAAIKLRSRDFRKSAKKS